MTVSPAATGDGEEDDEEEDDEEEEEEETFSESKQRSSSFIKSSKDETADILSLRLPPFQASSSPVERAEEEEDEEVAETRGSVSLGAATPESAMVCGFFMVFVVCV